METLPTGFWILFFSIILLTLGTAIYCCFRNRMIYWAYAVIVVALFVPIAGLPLTAQRAGGQNEWDYLISRIGEGSTWAILIGLSMLYIVAWWVLFFIYEIPFRAMVNKIRSSNKLRRLLEKLPRRKQERDRGEDGDASKKES